MQACQALPYGGRPGRLVTNGPARGAKLAIERVHGAGPVDQDDRFVAGGQGEPGGGKLALKIAGR